MKRPTVIILIILLVLIVAMAIYEDRHGTPVSKTNPTSSSQNIGAPGASNTKAANNASFSPAPTTNLAYQATIHSDIGNGTTLDATLLSDGKGTIQYSTTQSGQAVQITYTPSAYYNCLAGQCYKYPVNAGASADFDPSSYAYTSAQLTTYRQSAISKGKQSCPTGSCDTWSVSANGVTSTLYIDPASKHIIQVRSTGNGKSTTVSYDYKAISITLPANAQSITAAPH